MITIETKAFATRASITDMATICRYFDKRGWVVKTQSSLIAEIIAQYASAIRDEHPELTFSESDSLEILKLYLNKESQARQRKGHQPKGLINRDEKKPSTPGVSAEELEEIAQSLKMDGFGDEFKKNLMSEFDTTDGEGE